MRKINSMISETVEPVEYTECSIDILIHRERYAVNVSPYFDPKVINIPKIEMVHVIW